MDATVVGPVRVTLIGGTLEYKPSDTSSLVSLTIEGEQRVLVGRGGSCDLRLSDRLVSAAHCEFQATTRGVIVRDQGSKNGTKVNDVLLGPHSTAFLTKPAVIRVGGSALTLTPQTAGEERVLSRTFGPFVSQSTSMGLVYDRAHKFATLRQSIHIGGETGTGKSALARAIHNASARAHKPFLVVDCSSIPPALAEAELFGYEAGAFTGALRSRISPFVEADGGTVFLDEVGDLPLDVQAKLLRFVDEQLVKSLGQNKARKVDVRVMSATKHDLAGLVNAGRFREDLHSRLTALTIRLPPLRERLEDVECLVQTIVAELGHPDIFKDFSADMLASLKVRSWSSGNVRQLRQVLMNTVDLTRLHQFDIARALETAYSFGEGDIHVGTRRHEQALTMAAGVPAASLYEVLTVRGSDFKVVTGYAGEILLRVLNREANGNIAAIAKRAHLSRDFVRERLVEYGLREAQPGTPRRGKKSGRARSERDG